MSDALLYSFFCITKFSFENKIIILETSLIKGLFQLNYNPSPSRRCLPGDLAYIVEELWTLLVEWWGASPGLQVTPVEDERKGIIDQIKVTKSYIYIIILKNINREELFLINIEELFLNLFPHIHIVSEKTSILQ